MPSLVSQSLDGGPFQIRLQPEVDRLGGQDRRRPLHGVDLGDQRRDDQPCRVEDAVVAPALVVRAQLVADDVVLAGEQSVQPAQAEPPALVEAGEFHAARIRWQVPVVVAAASARRAASASCRRRRHTPLSRPTSATRRWRKAARCRRGRRVRSRDPHLVRPPDVVPCHALRQRHFDVVHAERVARVVDPVVNLELNPRRGKKVQRTGGQELFTGEQLLADRDRDWAR